MVCRHLAVLEGDLRGVGSALPGLVLDARHDIARCPGLHEESADAFLPRALVRHGENHRDVGALARGDELLYAVEHIVSILALGARGDGRCVRADLGLSEREGAEHFAFRQCAQVLALLRIVAVAMDDAGGQVVDHDDGRSGAIAGGDFLARDRHRAVVEAGAAPLIRNGDAVEAHRREPFQRLARELLVAIPARRIGRELLARIASHRFADFTVV